MIFKTGLPPLDTTDAHTLILGSFPGEVSLREKQYYAHPRNDFWRIICNFLKIPNDSSYKEKTSALVDAGFALWDVLDECSREGSQDREILRESEKVNPIIEWLNKHPKVDKILFNGKKAEECFHRNAPSVPEKIILICLPSTSSANTIMDLKEKCKEWNNALRRINIDVEEVDAEDDIEKELEDISLKLMEKPFDPTLIKIETKQPSLDLLIKRIKRKDIQMDTSTYFQRKDDLWSKTNQSRLIESVLIHFPLPAFFFDASDDNKWLIVDGLQRLSSIRNFVLENQPLTNLEFLTHLNGKKWDDLPDNLQRQIEETQVVIYKIMHGTPSDVKFNIFKRINTGGLVLEPQEIRHALFQGKPSKFISRLAETKEFKEATQYKIKTNRMLDRDFINRFLGFYILGVENYGTRDYGQDLDTYMSKAMEVIYDKTDEELDDIELQFIKSMKAAKAIFGKEAFRKVYREYKRMPPINKAYFDALSTQLAFLNDNKLEKLKSKKEILKKTLKNNLASDEYLFISITSATGDKNRTQYRHGQIKKLIQDVLNDRI